MTFHVIAPDHLPCRTTARQCVGLIAIHAIGVHGVRDEVDAALAAMVSQQADAVYVEGTLPRKLTIDLALEHRLPAAGVSPFAREGGLISYSVTGKWPPTQSKDAFSLSSGAGQAIQNGLSPLKSERDRPMSCNDLSLSDINSDLERNRRCHWLTVLKNPEARFRELRRIDAVMAHSPCVANHSPGVRTTM